MSESDSLIRKYYLLNSGQFSVLHSLLMSQGISENEVCEQSLSIILAKAANTELKKLYMTFSGVRNLRFRQPDWSEISIGYLEIMANDEVDAVSGRYLVRDAGQDQIIRFDCKGFDFCVD